MVANSAAIGLRPSKGEITATLSTNPSSAVTSTTTMVVDAMPQPSDEPSHHAVIIPTATNDPCAKLATFATPNTNDMPTATSA